jgi:hypothetical protein
MTRQLLRLALAMLCVISIAASSFLALSYLAATGSSNLRPIMWLAVFIAQSVLTLVTFNRRAAGMSARLAVTAGALGLGFVGWSIVQNTLTGPHFEGYALVMGLLGVAQSALTVALFTSTLIVPEHPRVS